MLRSAHAESEELLGFRDNASGLWLRFYRPGQRFDLWQEYAEGARRSYRDHGVEKALSLLPASPDSIAPVFAVACDDHQVVRGGWYANGPLSSVSHAHAPGEFVDEPVSATLIAEWISQQIYEGIIEMKGGWVDSSHPRRSGIADLLSRSYLHAMHLLGVRYACATAADHASSRWLNAGAQALPGIVPVPYPDQRYRTTFLWWDTSTALQHSTKEQQRLFAADLHAMRWGTLMRAVA